MRAAGDCRIPVRIAQSKKVPERYDEARALRTMALEASQAPTPGLICARESSEQPVPIGAGRGARAVRRCDVRFVSCWPCDPPCTVCDPSCGCGVEGAVDGCVPIDRARLCPQAALRPAVPGSGWVGVAGLFLARLGRPNRALYRAGCAVIGGGAGAAFERRQRRVPGFAGGLTRLACGAQRSPAACPSGPAPLPSCSPLPPRPVRRGAWPC